MNECHYGWCAGPKERYYGITEAIDAPFLGEVPYQRRTVAHEVIKYLDLKLTDLKLLEQESGHD